MTGLLLFFTFSFWRSSTTAEGDLSAMVERMNASDFIREYLGTSSGLITQNSIADAHPDSVDGSISPANYWTPIHAIPVTTSATGSGSAPLLYFRRPSINTSGNIIMNGTQPYEDEYILYLHRPTKTFRLRALANPSATNNRLKTTCPDAYVSSTCAADKKIIGDVSSIAIRYFSRSGNLIDYSSSTDSTTGDYNGPDYPVVEVAEITLNVSKRVFLQKTDSTINSTTVRVALRNT
jgi:hypothetical protein